MTATNSPTASWAADRDDHHVFIPEHARSRILIATTRIAITAEGMQAIIDRADASKVQKAIEKLAVERTSRERKSAQGKSSL